METNDCKFTQTHEWAFEEDGLIVVGISDYALISLRDIVFVELPKQGIQVNRGDEIATVESTRTTSTIYSPVSGTIEEVNVDLENYPELINESPFEDGWIVKILPDLIDEIDLLMDCEEYEAILEKGKRQNCESA